MLVDIQEFLNEAKIEESLYPGKRIVKPCKQTGEFKSHSVIMDWRDPSILRIEIRAGISGKQLAVEALKNYPVCFQMPTYVDIKVTNDNEEDEEEGKSKSGSSGGGGKKPARKKLKDIEIIAARFGDSAKGKIPAVGEIAKMVVMGVEMAKDAIGAAFGELTKQISHAKVSATELLAKASNLVTRVQPPSFLKPKGDETASYKYDREKNADIGMRMNI